MTPLIDQNDLRDRCSKVKDPTWTLARVTAAVALHPTQAKLTGRALQQAAEKCGADSNFRIGCGPAGHPPVYLASCVELGLIEGAEEPSLREKRDFNLAISSLLFEGEVKCKVTLTNGKVPCLIVKCDPIAIFAGPCAGEVAMLEPKLIKCSISCAFGFVEMFVNKAREFFNVDGPKLSIDKKTDIKLLDADLSVLIPNTDRKKDLGYLRTAYGISAVSQSGEMGLVADGLKLKATVGFSKDQLARLEFKRMVGLSGGAQDRVDTAIAFDYPFGRDAERNQDDAATLDALDQCLRVSVRMRERSLKRLLGRSKTADKDAGITSKQVFARVSRYDGNVDENEFGFASHLLDFAYRKTLGLPYLLNFTPGRLSKIAATVTTGSRKHKRVYDAWHKQGFEHWRRSGRKHRKVSFVAFATKDVGNIDGLNTPLSRKEASALNGEFLKQGVNLDVPLSFYEAVYTNTAVFGRTGRSSAKLAEALQKKDKTAVAALNAKSATEGRAVSREVARRLRCKL